MTSAAPRRNRRTVALAAACVAALVAVGLVVLNRGHAGGAQSAGQAVRIYLEALAKGDARGALAMAKQQPSDTSLLTDEVLQRQLRAAPITDIRILSPDDSPQVRVRAKFGDEVSEAALLVTPPAKGEPWRIDHAAIAVQSGGMIAAPLLNSMTVLGSPFPDTGTAFIFPGPMDLGTSNTYVTVKPQLAEPTLLNGLTGLAEMNLLPQFTLSDTGKADVTTAINDALQQCAISSQLEPRGCPQRVRAGNLVDGTASWVGVQPNGINVGQFFDQTRGTVNFVGMANFLGLTVEENDGGTFSMPKLVVGVMGTADVTHRPPKITMGGTS
jgi:hypothetical protein